MKIKLKTFTEQLQSLTLPNNYLLGFYLCQFFEFNLRTSLITCIGAIKFGIKSNQLSYEPTINNNWNANDYFQRLLTYFPKEKHPNFYKNVKKAITDRNDFVHKTFRVNPNSILSVAGECYFNPHAKSKLSK
jgi:hypothetical protein